MPPLPPSVHPHACGDDMLGGGLGLASAGSPPRVWGRPCFEQSGIGFFRFTPTRVGTTGACPHRRPRLPVHPHACGDDVVVLPAASVPSGSPPRVWGRQREGREVRRRYRFTPTRVGTTYQATQRISHSAVHPHACGDDAIRLHSFHACRGSPPRVWGRPAWRFCSSVRSPVHPHACGDDVENGIVCSFDLRFTPTRVGTTPPR